METEAKKQNLNEQIEVDIYIWIISNKLNLIKI